jgi:tellurite resistance protein
MWGLSLFFLLWLLPIAKRIAAQPFGLTFWSLSFPLAALSSLTLRVGDLFPDAAAVQTAGVLLLAVASMVILWLGFATVRGLRDSTLLVPEPLANIQPVSV